MRSPRGGMNLARSARRVGNIGAEIYVFRWGLGGSDALISLVGATQRILLLPHHVVWIESNEPRLQLAVNQVSEEKK